LETERLILRQFRADDFDDYAALCADPEVMRYLGDGKTKTRAEAWMHMAALLGHWELRGYGLWAVEEKTTGRLAGRIGLLNLEGWPQMELAWTLARSRWGLGFATEGARAAMDYAFSAIKADHLISMIVPANAGQIRVAERIGERFERQIELFGKTVSVYGVSRP
jgi:RimJ/RimL family protein N-acetyltransferase